MRFRGATYLWLVASILPACGGSDDTNGEAGGGGQSGMPATGGAAGAESAVSIKFCNTVGFGEAGNPRDIELRLDLGGDSGVLSLSALTGTCEPPIDTPCATALEGRNIPLSLVDASISEDPIALGTLTAERGEAWVIVADATGGIPVLDGIEVPQGTACAALDYDRVFELDAGDQ